MVAQFLLIFAWLLSQVLNSQSTYIKIRARACEYTAFHAFCNVRRWQSGTKKGNLIDSL